MVVDDECGFAFEGEEEGFLFGLPGVGVDRADGAGLFDHGVRAELVDADEVDG